MVEIVDYKSAEAWLEGQDHQTQICFAARSALRGLPGLGRAAPATLRNIALPGLRATLISAVAGKVPTADIKRAADSAARSTANSPNSAAYSAARSAGRSAANYAARSAANSAANSAAESARSADSAESARSAAYSAAAKDASHLAQSDEAGRLFSLALWHEDGMPDGLAKNLQSLTGFWQDDPAVWGYWERWYDGFLSGAPLNWDVQLAIAQLDDADWKEGPAWVASKIAEIEAELLSKCAPLAEKIEFNDETGKFHATPQPIAKPDLVEATLQQIADALEDVLALPSNGLSKNARETRTLRKTLEKYAKDPQQIELNLVSVSRGLRRQLLETKELPESPENLALLETAEEGALAIRATHPEVAENRKILALRKFVELPEEDKDVVEHMLAPLLLLSEWQVHDDFKVDIPELLTAYAGPSGDYAPALPGVVRTFSRVAEISKHPETKSAIEKIEKNKTFRSIVIGGTVVGFGLGLVRLVEIGLKLFGIL